jgi:hypothetical protein
VKLIEGVEFDEDDEPTNLTERVEALVSDYPLLQGTPPKPKAPNINGGGGGDDKKPDLTPEEIGRLHGSAEAATAADVTP